MQDLCRVLIAKHNDSLSCAGSEGRMGCSGAKISLWTVPGNPEMRPSIGGWPYIYIVSINNYVISCLMCSLMESVDRSRLCHFGCPVRSGEDIHNEHTQPKGRLSVSCLTFVNK
jgi:hypothetical protein